MRRPLPCYRACLCWCSLAEMVASAPLLLARSSASPLPLGSCLRRRRDRPGELVDPLRDVQGRRMELRSISRILPAWTSP